MRNILWNTLLLLFLLILQSLKRDRISNENIRGTVKVVNSETSKNTQELKLRLYGHLTRLDGEEAMEMEVMRNRKRGRPKPTLMACINVGRSYIKENSLNPVRIRNMNMWRKIIYKDDPKYEGAGKKKNL